jgi:FtsP/CotA-like multicopper oxidase with cupredoxin domain
MKRRDFLKLSMAGVAGLAATPATRLPAWAQASAPVGPAATALKAVKRSLDINGKSANVFGLVQDNGAPGVAIEPGGAFDVSLVNDLAEPTLVHWHGLSPPWPLDGVPDVPAPLMKPGETRRYAFPVPEPGTYWMHAHTIQEQNLLAAPLIVRAAGDAARDEQEVVILLYDFSFTSAEELVARLKTSGGAMRMSMAGMNHDAMQGHMAHMAGMNHDAMQGDMAHMGGMAPAMKPGSGMAGMATMDLNDIEYDAYLANDRTLEDPEIVRVERNGAVRLRIINAAAATAFTIDAGALRGELIAVDGQDVAPVAGSLFPIVMGQRLDIRLTLPQAGGAFPILALREGARERTGIVLATPSAPIGKIATLGARKGPVVGLDLEGQLKAMRPLAERAPDRRVAVTLTGTMAGYAWGIDGADALKVKSGERVEIAMRNMSMMMHPMHLHGHRFQVVGVNGRAVKGALRDTVAVPPMAAVTIAFDAMNPGRWAFHCHHLYHMATGMMAFVNYEGAA